MTADSKTATARARRAVATFVCLLAMAAAVVGVPTTRAEAQAPTPPPRPAVGVLGGPGPCTSRQVDAPNGFFPNQRVWVIEPQGSGQPRTGGTCGTGTKPTIFMAHGWRRCDQEAADPLGARDLVNNLVSNGYVLIFPNYCSATEGDFITDGYPTYEMMLTGFVQATGMTDRENLAHIGVLGHSFGGGMSPWLAEKLWERRWGTQSLWVAVLAPYRPLRGGYPPTDPANPNFVLPPHTRSLNVLFQHDQVCQQAGVPWPVCDVPGWSRDIYNRMPMTDDRQWGVWVNSDCSHLPAAQCNPPTDTRLLADHYVPGTKAGGVVYREDNHIKYYGLYRNIGALADCARSASSPSCSVSRTTMGVWSDGVAATAAYNCTPSACP